MTGVSLRNTEQESNNLDRKREREKIIPQKENPRRNSRPNPGGKIAVRGRCFHRSPGDKVWGRKCKLGGKSGRSLRSRFREHAFGPGPKCTDYGSVFLNRAFIIIIIQPPLAINEKSPRYLSILIRSRHPARPPIIPSINLFEAKNRSWIGEREREGKKKEEREQRFYLSTGPVYRSCRRGEIRWKFYCFLSVQADLFQELHTLPPPLYSVWATSVGMLPAELNSRWLASGKLSVYTEKTCKTKNVAPTNEASPFCFLDWKRFNGSEIVRSHSLGGCKQRHETFPPSTKYLCISFNGNWGDMHVNLLADFIGNFTFLGRIKATWNLW